MPRILDELGDELVRAARASETQARGRGWSRLPRSIAIALGAMMVLAAGAVAAGLVIGRGDPIAPAPAGQVPAELQPVPGTAQLNGLNVPDPDGGPPWDVRTSRSQTGAICVSVGQVLDGDFGLVGLDRRFRTLPTGAADTCSAPQQHGATIAGARAFRGGGRLREITVVSGVAAAGVREVVAVGGGRTQPLKLGPGRAFLAIFPGTPEQTRPRITLTEADGQSSTLRFADTGEYLAPDPSAGAPWTITRETHNAGPGVRCVQIQRERGPDSPTPLDPQSGAFNAIVASVPPRCGRRGTAFVDVRRFVPRKQTRGNESWWGLNVARTIAWGAAARSDSIVTLRAPGRPRPIPVDPRTHGFAVILDGRVDPRSVRLTIDGKPFAAMDGVTGRRGNAVGARTATPPPWRSVASVAKQVGVPEPLIAQPRTARIARRAEDPTGGAPWAMRTWSARTDPRVRGSGESELRCYQIGHPEGDRLVLPQPDGGTRALDLSSRNGFCNGPRWLSTHGGGAWVRVEVDDATAPDPRPQRTIVAGLLGGGIRSAELLGAGTPIPLDLGPDGTFLVVLDAAHAFAAFKIRQTRTDGTVRTSATDGLAEPCRLQPGNHVLVADPDGGPPWVFGRSTVGQRGCSFTGRVVAGTLVYLADDGTVRAGPSSFTSAPPRARHTHKPPKPGRLSFRIEGPGLSPTREAPAPAGPQIARRTQPGRTIVIGEAAADIETVTIRSPRDVRTVKPVDGLFMAVYDGAFYTGQIAVTGHRRDGTTVTVRQPATYP